jgi:hypothetical protein
MKEYLTVMTKQLMWAPRKQSVHIIYQYSAFSRSVWHLIRIPAFQGSHPTNYSIIYCITTILTEGLTSASWRSRAAPQLLLSCPEDNIELSQNLRRSLPLGSLCLTLGRSLCLTLGRSLCLTADAIYDVIAPDTSGDFYSQSAPKKRC